MRSELFCDPFYKRVWDIFQQFIKYGLLENSLTHKSLIQEEKGDNYFSGCFYFMRRQDGAFWPLRVAFERVQLANLLDERRKEKVRLLK